MHGGHSTRVHSPPPVSMTTSQPALHYSTASAAESDRSSVSAITSIVASSGSAMYAHESVKHRKLEQGSEARPAVSVGTVKSSAGQNYMSAADDRHNVDGDSAAECSDMLSHDEQPDSPSVVFSDLAQSEISSVDDGNDDDDDDYDADVIVISSSSPDDDY